MMKKKKQTKAKKEHVCVKYLQIWPSCDRYCKGHYTCDCENNPLNNYRK